MDEKTKKQHLSKTLLIIGSLFRLRGVPMASVWYDEAYSLAIAKLPLFGMLRVQASDFNPPLWEIVIWPIMQFTDSVFIPRLIACSASIAALYLFWLIMGELGFTDNQRLYASALAAFLPGNLLVAQDARVYAVLTMLIMAATLAAITGRWLTLTAISGLILYSHTTGGAFLAGVYLLAWYKHPAQLRRIIISGCVAIAAWLPWLPTILSTSGEFWLGRLTLSYFLMSASQAVWASPAHPLLGALVFIIIITAVVSTVAKRKNNTVLASAIIVLLPLALMVVVSVFYVNVCFYRPLTLFLLPVSIWLGAVLAPNKITLPRLALPAMGAAVLAVGLLGYSPALKGGGLASTVREVVQPGDVVFYVTGTAALPAEYYLTDIPHEAYILDATQHPALLRDSIQYALGYNRARLGNVRPDVILYPQDPLITPAVQADVNYYLQSQPIGSVHTIPYWQAADILVFDLPRGCCGCRGENDE